MEENLVLDEEDEPLVEDALEDKLVDDDRVLEKEDEEELELELFEDGEIEELEDCELEVDPFPVEVLEELFNDEEEEVLLVGLEPLDEWREVVEEVLLVGWELLDDRLDVDAE